MKLTADSDDSDDKTIIVIAGPTASGKTASAIALSHRIPCEIISADSRQIYRYADIGTAKPTRAQCAETPHHLVDIREPEEVFDAGQFVSAAGTVIQDIRSRGKQPFIVGGTGLYIKSFMDGLAVLPSRDPEIRQKLQNRIATEGLSSLFDELKEKDPDTASRIDAHNPVRIIRALEVLTLTGKGMTYHHRKTIQSKYRFMYFCFRPAKDILMKRIQERTAAMIHNGIIEETESLLKRGCDEQCPVFLSVGYRRVIEYLKKNIDKKQLYETIVTDTWQYAKRQITWFKKDQRIIPVQTIEDIWKKLS